MTEYKVVKHFIVCGEVVPTEEEFKDYYSAKAIFDAWKIDDKNLDGYKLARIDIYEIVDGEVLGRCNAK